MTAWGRSNPCLRCWSAARAAGECGPDRGGCGGASSERVRHRRGETTGRMDDDIVGIDRDGRRAAVVRLSDGATDERFRIDMTKPTRRRVLQVGGGRADS